MSVGKEIGFVLDLGDGTLKRTRGILVQAESDTAVVAVPVSIAPEGSQSVDVATASGASAQVSFVQVSTGDITTDFEGWTRSACFAEQPVIQNVLRAFYREDREVKRVETDSMVSAQSSLRQTQLAEAAAGLVERVSARDANSRARSSMGRSAGSQQVTFADSDDEDFATELMHKFAAARGPSWGAANDEGEVLLVEGRSEQTYQRVVDRMTGNAGKRHGEKTSEAPDLSGSSNQVIMMALMELLKKQKSGNEEQPGGKAVRRLQKLRSRVETEPEAIVGLYLEEIMDKLGTEPGDAFQPWMWTSRISWGKLAGLHRVHFHLSHILGLSLKGKKKQAEAYTVQLLRSLHQVSLDNGMWSTAALLLPRPDPIYRENFGATETELEAVVGYQEALKKIRSKTQTDDGGDDKDAKPPKGGGKGQPG